MARFKKKIGHWRITSAAFCRDKASTESRYQVPSNKYQYKTYLNCIMV